MFEILFISSVFMIFFSYVGYPISLYLVGLVINKKVRKNRYFPKVSILITAYNEGKRIVKKLENTLEIIYPKDKFQIILASDGSTDDTNKIAESYEKSGVELLTISIRAGKENAQKEALKIAKGEVVVFTDVATMLEPNGVETIVSNFADPTVGCVSSEDRFIGRDVNPSGEGFYVRYEMLLRRLESRVNSLVGLSGSFLPQENRFARIFLAICKAISGHC